MDDEFLKRQIKLFLLNFFFTFTVSTIQLAQFRDNKRIRINLRLLN